MIRVSQFPHDDHVVQLLEPAEVRGYQNLFTVVVGKNGVGKSRLLGEIARVCSRDKSLSEFADRGAKGPVVIAASTSPFDKFPAPGRRRSKNDRSYRYIGMRGEGLYGVSSAVSLLSSASRGLLSKLASTSPSANLLCVFGSLDFNPHFEFVFKPLFRRVGGAEETGRMERREGVAKVKLGRHYYLVETRLITVLDGMSPGDHMTVAADLEQGLAEWGKAQTLALQADFTLNEAYLFYQRISSDRLAAILRLFDLGLLRLTDILVEKRGYGALSLRRASSGEQCLLVLMLGIAGHIQDGSLILIDEPEISLHPEWQESFMEMLQAAFSHYHGCQFIVATHSPQIIARLQGEGAFVYSLSKRELYSADQFSSRSADFQLAELFDAPGLMNEYIARVCFNLIAQLRSDAYPALQVAQEIERLVTLREKLRGDDRLRGLIDSVQELYGAQSHD